MTAPSAYAVGITPDDITMISQVAEWAHMSNVRVILDRAVASSADMALTHAADLSEQAERNLKEAVQQGEEAKKSEEESYKIVAWAKEYLLNYPYVVYDAEQNGKDLSEAVKEAEAKRDIAESEGVRLKELGETLLENQKESRAAAETAARLRTFADAASKSAEVARFNASLALIIDVVLCENAPSLLLLEGFFCLRKHNMSRFGIAKTVMSMALSAASALKKAADVSKFGDTGRLIAVPVVLMVLYAVLKMGAAFACPSGFFSFQTMKCDEVVE